MSEQALQTQVNPLNYSREQLDLIKRTFATGCTDDEFQLFMLTAERMGLRPEFKQIHVVKRKAKDADGRWIDKISIQTGIDGYRAIADRTGRYVPGGEPKFEYDANNKLKSATAYVKKFVGNQWHEVAATAHMSEYVQTYRKDNEIKPTQMWADKPHIMLSKCAEALALRRAFPAELSGVYTDEEMQQADVARADVVEAETVTVTKHAPKPEAPPTMTQKPQPTVPPVDLAKSMGDYMDKSGKTLNAVGWHKMNDKACDLARSMKLYDLASDNDVPSDIKDLGEIERHTRAIVEAILAPADPVLAAAQSMGGELVTA
jgi:phage recombination protein Bet